MKRFCATLTAISLAVAITSCAHRAPKPQPATLPVDSFALLPKDSWPASQPVPYVNRAALELVRKRDILNDAAWSQKVNVANESASEQKARADALEDEHSWWTTIGLPVTASVGSAAIVGAIVHLIDTFIAQHASK